MKYLQTVALIASAFASPVSGQESYCDRLAINLANINPTMETLRPLQTNLFCKSDTGFNLLDLISHPAALYALLHTSINGQKLDPNEVNDIGRTALFYVDYIESAQHLIDAGANPLVRDESGRTPLFTVRDPLIIEYLLELGVDATARSTRGGTALHEAKDALSVELLVEAGADPNARDRDGYTPFMAAMYESIDVAQALVDAGADPFAATDLGRTALHSAESAEQINFIVSLADHPDDVNVDVETISGFTPLHDAALFNRKEAIETLLILGASPTATTSDGDTPFDLISKGCLELALLVDCLEDSDLYWRLNDLRFQ
jgi:ankyrin repeat protein